MAPPPTIASNVLPAALALPFAAAALVALLGRRLGRSAGWIVAAAAAGSSLLLLGLPGHDAVSSFRVPWLPEIGVEFALRADPFGRFFALLVSGVGFFVALYAISYMADDDERRMPRFWGALAAFMGAMLGIALSDDMLLLFLFWEITSLSSFLLIGHHDDEPAARAGALLALQVTALGGLVLALGVLLVAQVTGTFSMSAIGGDPARVRALLDSPLAPVALGCILVGVFTKSAQFPFHFWLPRAMVAPTPVSAYLHAATMVKAGPFLLGRMLPVFGSLPMWTPVLASVGLVTMLLGAWKAFRETDLKAILARTTGSTLGLLTLLYGFGAAEQDALQMLNHALYKGALFLVAGIVDHHAHTRDLRRLGGLRRELPLPFLAAVLAGLSMAGVPPLLGFLVKESFYEELLHNEAVSGFAGGRALVVFACVLANVFVAAVAAKFVLGTFLGERRDAAHQAPGQAAREGHDDHRPSGPPLWISPLALATGALALGLLGATDFTSHLAGAIASRRANPFHVSLVPSPGLPLWLSMAGMAAAVALYLARGRVERIPDLAESHHRPDRLWERMVASLAVLGEDVSMRWQNGSLRRYLAATLLSVPVLAGWALFRAGLSHRDVVVSLSELPWFGLFLCVLLGIATMIAVTATTRLQASIATTTIGFLVSMLFVVYRSPDILLTQILIETVSTIFVLLVLLFMPAFPRRDMSGPAHLGAIAVATVFSLVLTLLLLLSMTPGLREEANIAVRPGGLLSLALEKGGGANAVNVIIVDIRSLDTNGEITVLVAVGLCVYALLRARRARGAGA
ncbi:DUF4040 domain-containing protein [bacterium]|nr:DUF4040 domain-containing protein [bacterium]